MEHFWGNESGRWWSDCEICLLSSPRLFGLRPLGSFVQNKDGAPSLASVVCDVIDARSHSCRSALLPAARCGPRSLRFPADGAEAPRPPSGASGTPPTWFSFASFAPRSSALGWLPKASRPCLILHYPWRPSFPSCTPPLAAAHAGRPTRALDHRRHEDPHVNAWPAISVARMAHNLTWRLLHGRRWAPHAHWLHLQERGGRHAGDIRIKDYLPRSWWPAVELGAGAARAGACARECKDACFKHRRSLTLPAAICMVC